jgi:hypothetical protein
MERDRPVRIAGGGLSGLAAAITLARAGVEVEVYERRERPGSRHHFDLQGIENWSQERDVLERLGDFGLRPDCPLYPIRELHLLDGRRQGRVAASERPVAYLVQRGPGPGTLDDALWRMAESCGVRVRCRASLSRSEADIWAAGPPRATGIVCGYTFKTSHAPLAVCLLDEECAPGGYAYATLAGGEGTLAVVLLRSFRKARECLEKSREILVPRFGFSMENGKPFGGVGHFRFPRGEGREVGEAGGFQDLLFGFGIYMALATGQLAARSLLEGVSYQRLWRRELSPVLKASVTNRLLFELGGSLGHRFLIHEAQRLGPQRFLARWYGYGLTKALLFPLARLWLRFRFPTARRTSTLVTL